MEYVDDTVRSMLGLEAGRTYQVQIANDALSAFSRWQYGRKLDLLSGSEEEKRQRWNVNWCKRVSLRDE